jgi:hypothetical protein
MEEGKPAVANWSALKIVSLGLACRVYSRLGYQRLVLWWPRRVGEKNYRHRWGRLFHAVYGAGDGDDESD